MLADDNFGGFNNIIKVKEMEKKSIEIFDIEDLEWSMI